MPLFFKLSIFNTRFFQFGCRDIIIYQKNRLNILGNYGFKIRRNLHIGRIHPNYGGGVTNRAPRSLCLKSSYSSTFPPIGSPSSKSSKHFRLFRSEDIKRHIRDPTQYHTTHTATLNAGYDADITGIGVRSSRDFPLGNIRV